MAASKDLVLTVEKDDLDQGGTLARVEVSDPEYPHVTVAFEYEDSGDAGFIDLHAVRVERTKPAHGYRPDLQAAEFKSRFPWSRWEKAARTAAAEVLLGTEDPQVADSLAHGTTRGHIHLIAMRYRENVKKGLRDPVAAIARDMGVRPGTVRVWVYRARDMGFLGPARARPVSEAGPAPGALGERATLSRGGESTDPEAGSLDDAVDVALARRGAKDRHPPSPVKEEAPKKRVRQRKDARANDAM